MEESVEMEEEVKGQTGGAMISSQDNSRSEPNSPARDNYDEEEDAARNCFHLVNKDGGRVTPSPVLQYVLDEDLPYDTILSCGDGKIGTHRLVLASASPFFRDMVNSCDHISVLVLILPDIRCSIMKVLLNFAYTGEMVFSEEEEAEVREAKKMLEFPKDEDLIKKKVTVPIPVKEGPAFKQGIKRELGPGSGRASRKKIRILEKVEVLSTSATSEDLSYQSVPDISYDPSAVLDLSMREPNAEQDSYLEENEELPSEFFFKGGGQVAPYMYLIAPCNSGCSQTLLFHCYYCDHVLNSFEAMEAHLERDHGIRSHSQQAPQADIVDLLYCGSCNHDKFTSASRCLSERFETRCYLCLETLKTSEFQGHVKERHMICSKGDKLVVKCRWCDAGLVLRTPVDHDLILWHVRQHLPSGKVTLPPVQGLKGKKSSRKGTKKKKKSERDEEKKENEEEVSKYFVNELSISGASSDSDSDFKPSTKVKLIRTKSQGSSQDQGSSQAEARSGILKKSQKNDKTKSTPSRKRKAEKSAKKEDRGEPSRTKLPVLIKLKSQPNMEMVSCCMKPTPSKKRKLEKSTKTLSSLSELSSSKLPVLSKPLSKSLSTAYVEMDSKSMESTPEKSEKCNADADATNEQSSGEPHASTRGSVPVEPEFNPDLEIESGAMESTPSKKCNGDGTSEQGSGEPPHSGKGLAPIESNPDLEMDSGAMNSSPSKENDEEESKENKDPGETTNAKKPIQTEPELHSILGIDSNYGAMKPSPSKECAQDESNKAEEPGETPNTKEPVQTEPEPQPILGIDSSSGALKPTPVNKPSQTSNQSGRRLGCRLSRKKKGEKKGTADTKKTAVKN